MSQDPQYQLQDSNGNKLGAVYIDADGNLALESANGDAKADGVMRKSGHLSGYLSTTQNTVETGKYANVFENLEVNDGPYTKNTASEVQVNKAGTYKLTWQTNFKQVGGSMRATMQSHPAVNGIGRQEFRAYVYIRLANGDGDSSGCGNTAVFDLAAGDTLGVFCTEHTATGYDHDLRYASATIEYLG